MWNDSVDQSSALDTDCLWLVEAGATYLPVLRISQSPLHEATVHVVMVRDLYDMAVSDTGLFWMRHADSDDRFGLQELQRFEEADTITIVATVIGTASEQPVEHVTDDYLVGAGADPIAASAVIYRTNCRDGSHVRLQVAAADWSQSLAHRWGVTRDGCTTRRVSCAHQPMTPGRFYRIWPHESAAGSDWLELVRLKSRERLLISFENVVLRDRQAILIGHVRRPLPWAAPACNAAAILV